MKSNKKNSTTTMKGTGKIDLSFEPEEFKRSDGTFDLFFTVTNVKNMCGYRIKRYKVQKVLNNNYHLN